MSEITHYPLWFDEKDGSLTTLLPDGARAALKKAFGCLPWTSNGRRGLLYCREDVFRRAMEELNNTSRISPLLSATIRMVTHIHQIDERGVLTVPPSAAQFAGLRGAAMLGLISEECFLLLPAGQTPCPH